MPLGPDSYNVNIVDYVGPSQTGAVISQVLGVPFTVTVNTVNSVSATLAAVIASLGVVPNTFSDNHSRLNSSNVLEVAGTAPASETVVALDAVGNVLPLALQPTCTNVAVSSSNSTVLTVGTPSNQNFTLSTQSLSSLPVTLTLGATCNGTNYTGSPLAVPVEELLVVAGNAIDGYGSFSSGLGYLDTMTIPGTNVGGLIRVNAVSQVVYVLDSVSGTFYSVTAGGAPIKLFTSPNAVGSADFAISPDGSSLYFSNRNNNVVFRIPFAFGVVTDAYSVSQPIQVDFDAAGNLYVAQVNFSGTVSKLPAGGTAFQSYVGGLYYPASLRVGNAANGGYLYVGLDNGSGQTYVYQGQTLVSNGTQASSYAFNAVGDVYMVNGYTNPATITVYPPGSTTARAGTKMTIAPGRASGEAEFII